MRKIDADALLMEMQSYGKGVADANYQEWTMMIAENIVRHAPTLEEDTICECNLAENAALVCDVLNADRNGISYISGKRGLR